MSNAAAPVADRSMLDFAAGVSQLRKGDLPGAAATLRRALAANPREPLILSALGAALLDLGHSSEGTLLLEKAFARLEAKPLSEPHQGKLPPLSGRVFREVRAEGEEGVTLAWHAVPSDHADVVALEVMDRLLDDAKVGLLNTRLELTQKVPSAGSWFSALREAGFGSMVLGGASGITTSPVWSKVAVPPGFTQVPPRSARSRPGGRWRSRSRWPPAYPRGW